MLKAMVFIDGPWLGKSLEYLARKRGKRTLYTNRLDYGPIWQAICDHIHSQLGFEVDLVRAYFVASHADPETVGEGSQTAAKKIVGRLGELRRVNRMSLELYAYGYGGHEFKSKDKDEPDDGYQAKEKCVDVALATKMLYFAALPAAYDVAVLVTGDQDYVPVVRAVRSLGKRTMLASFLEVDACARVLRDESARGDLWDLPMLPLDDLVAAQLRAK